MKGTIKTLPTTAIMANPDQPRKHFDSAALSELAASIKANGLLQPIVVVHRPRKLAAPNGEQFMIVAGERRWRAHVEAGLPRVDCIVREMTADTVADLALLENVNRQDLQPLEEAEAYQRQIDRGHTEASLAALLGFKDTKKIKARLALLSLEPQMKQALSIGALALSQAEQMSRLSTEGQFLLWRAIQDGKCNSFDACRRVALAIYRAENQESLFTEETKLTPAQRESLSKVDLFIAKVEGLVGFLSEADMAVVRQIQKSDAATCIDKLDALQRTLSYLRGTMATSLAKQQAVELTPNSTGAMIQ